MESVQYVTVHVKRWGGYILRVVRLVGVLRGSENGLGDTRPRALV